MDVSRLLAEDKPVHSRRLQPSIEGTNNQTQFAKWQNHDMNGAVAPGNRYLDHSPQRPTAMRASGMPASPYASGPPPKHVTFEYILPEAPQGPEGPQQRARLPMRVNIWPHDATDSIITTVKNFYGLYEVGGVSFEDKDGCTLIARYENFQDRQTVHVRVIEEVASSNGTPRTSMSPKRPSLGPPFEMGPPHANQMQPGSRPASRAARNRSMSPHNNREIRSVSVSTNPKSRSRPIIKGRAGSAHGSFADPNGQHGQESDSDGGNGSVTSSRRGKIDVVASAEISVENIVEGGRRKRARFDSSELPLFVPSQVPGPMSLSSVSPQRRIDNPNTASPYQYSNQRTFSYTPLPLPSPQSHGHSDLSYMANGGSYSTPNAASYGNRGLRQRPAYTPAGIGAGNRILPTPDPTVGSVISDEDVALQLMRLGDASNFSSHGRISTSTLDDALSGKAEVSEASDDGSIMDEDDLPRAGYASDEYSGEEYEDNQDASFKGESDGIMPENMDQLRPDNGAPKIDDGSAPKRMGSISRKSAKPSGKPKSKIKTEQGMLPPISPTSLPAQSRKTSMSSLNFGPDEEDLSTKPRCQRCRKSKKGCDRQRPCGRCRDAGIGIEGCVSEDEGNGRKGRYGRHMGVAVKKDSNGNVPADAHTHMTSFHTSMGPPSMMGVNNKKRKR